MPEPALRGNYLNSEEPIVSNLATESLSIANPLITDLSTLILVQVLPPRVTPYERQIVLREAMEENNSTSSSSPHTLVSTTTTEGMLPPNPPSPVRTIVVSTPSTSSSGPILSSAMITSLFT
jgi:hypothetical protein